MLRFANLTGVHLMIEISPFEKSRRGLRACERISGVPRCSSNARLINNAPCARRAGASQMNLDISPDQAFGPGPASSSDWPSFSHP
jgi:hypothetical protein